MIQCCPAHFQQAHYIGHLVTSNKILVISRLIMKFMKILWHENLELYSIAYMYKKGTYCPDIVLICPAQITIQITV